MKLKPSLIFFSFIGIIGVAFVVNRFHPFGSGDPNPQKEAALVRTMMGGLDRMHFQPKPIDDDFSTQVFDLYLKNIDGGKRFFTQADIDQLNPFKQQIDNQLQNGTFEFFNLSSQLLDQSLTKTQGWYREILAKPLDFTANQTLEADGKKLTWANNDAELRQRWEAWMKYEVLNRINDEQEKQEKPAYTGEKKSFEALEAESRQKVLDVYDKWFKRMEKMDRDRRMEIFLNAVTNVFDPHTGYFSPKEKENFDIQMSGKLEGIGARLQSDGEKTSVTEIVPGGPAWKDGTLQPKDVVLKVGQEGAEPMDVMGLDIDDVVSKIRGPKGTRVFLTIQKPDGSVKEVTLTRDVVIMEEGFAKSLILHSNQTPDARVGYIYLPKFYADFTPQGLTSCAQDVAKEIDKLKGENVKGIILDLRNNGGGSLRDVVQMSGLFIEQGPIVQVKSRTKNPEIMEDLDPRVQYGGPLIVMVNGYSASASEILAAAMQDYGRALIVGASRTYGKGTVQRFFDLDNATGDNSVKPLGQMKITVQKFYRITGKTTQLDGVTPDIVLPDFYNLLDNGERENDYPLQANTIDPVAFGQNAYHIADMPQLRTASENRVKADPTFKLITENASRLRKMEDQSTYPLEAAKYRLWEERQKKESERFENIFKPIDDFVVENLAADLPQIQSDTSRIARNEDWIKDRRKDIQLYETLRIMQDMIRMDALAGKR
ncbi:MAG: carboxy terminal-processing peptidase [Saprospiraceae bacterium]